MTYTKHARIRMRQYGVTGGEVAEAVLGYDTCVPARGGRENRWKRFGGYRLRVTYDPVARVVITVWKEGQ